MIHSSSLSIRYGHRGCWLMLLGLFWIMFGVASMLNPDTGEPWVLISYAPPVIQAACWWVTGGIAVTSGMMGKRRDDTVGHVALYLMPAIKVLSLSFSALIYGLSLALVWGNVMDHAIGYADGWYPALVWVLVSACLVLAASWPNPAAPPVMPGADLWADEDE